MEPNNFSGDTHLKPWFDRNGFSPWVVALLWIMITFILFQMGGALFAIIGLLISPNVEFSLQALEQISGEVGILFWANTISQVLFLALGTWIFARLSVHPPQRAEFFRLQAPKGTAAISVLAALIIFAMQPLVWLLSWINLQLPVPETLVAFEQGQLEMIEQILTGDYFIMLTIMHVALVPAICEEVLYRGYILRLFERSWGIWAAIIVSGVIFGLYHLRLTQVIPLAAIGIVLAWVTIKSGSLIPAIAGHFVNNAGSVIAAYVRPDLMFDEEITTELPSIWLILLSAVVTIILFQAVINIANMHQTDNQEAV